VTEVTLRAAAVDAVVAHAREAAPAECCGLLIGRDGAILEAVRARNVAGRPTRFEIDAKNHIDARRDARARGLAVVGFYHSHPQSPPEPSARDRDEASYADHLYLIVSLASDPPGIGVFRLSDGNFQEVRCVTVG